MPKKKKIERTIDNQGRKLIRYSGDSNWQVEE